MDQVSSRGRVFVVHEPMRKVTDAATNEVTWVRMRDVTPAREYGDLVHLFPAGHLTQDPKRIMMTAREGLADFSGRDYLLPMGDSTAIAAATVVASQHLHDDETVLKVLIWDHRNQRYFVQPLEVWPSDDAET